MNEKMRSCVMGLILGQFSSPLPMAQKEPVAYLYNGVRLPALPEWDSEMYPYAFILRDKDSQTIEGLYCLAAEATQGFLSVYMSGDGADNGSPKLLFSYTDDGVWRGPYDKTSNAISGGLYNTIVWSNYDLYYTDASYNGDYAGKLCCAKSDPIPVYE